jgi:hypothetical protein
MGQDPVLRERDARVESGFRSISRTPVALRYRGHELALAQPVIVIGRGGECELMLASPLVSRRHAQIVNSADGITIEDLGSRNGVYVNGELLKEPRRLEVGDRIDLGGEELELVPHEGSDPAKSRDTQLRLAAAQATPSAQDERTRQASAFVLLGGLLDKLLALSRADEAERLMMTHLERVLLDAQRGARPEAYASAAQYAVRLAEATGRARWVDYTVRLYLAIGEPLPTPQIDALHAIVRRVRGVDVLRLREYVAVLKLRAPKLGPAERFAIRRIESLADVAAL